MRRPRRSMYIIALLFLILMFFDNASCVNLEILNICGTKPRTLSVRYSFATAKSSSNGGRFTLGPKAHTSVSLPDANSGFVWAIAGVVGQCAARSESVPPKGVSAVFFDVTNGSYYVSYASGRNVDMDVCPQLTTTDGGSLCTCGSTCPFTSMQRGRLECAKDCDCQHTCKPSNGISGANFTVTFCPIGRGSSTTTTKPTTSRTTPSTSTRRPHYISMCDPPSVPVLDRNKIYPSYRPCGCSVNQLWLDIILVVDISKNMGESSLQKIIGRIVTAFHDVPVGQKLVHQTRIGIVTYDAQAKVVGQLTKYADIDDMQHDLFYMASSGVDRVNIYEGLKASVDVFNAVPKIRTRQRLIILVASAYRQAEQDPTALSKQIRKSGHKLMTISVVSTAESTQELANISALASPGYGFRSDVDAAKFASDFRSAICRANCFCPDGWYQLTDSFYDPTVYFAECIKLSSDEKTWFDAAQSCPDRTEGRAFLSSQLSRDKYVDDEQFVQNGLNYTGPFHIGLSFNATIANYVWEEKYTNCSHILLDPSFEPWAGGKENHTLGGNGVQVVIDDIHDKFSFHPTSWKNVDVHGDVARYLCEQVACDTDVYCDDSVDDGL